MTTQKRKAIERKHVARINHLIRVGGNLRELTWRRTALANLIASA